MKRHRIPSRTDWQTKVESLGFNFHTLNGIPYWDESCYYEFTYEQVEIMESVTAELYRMCLAAVDHVIQHDLFELFCIDYELGELIKKSWVANTPSVYGRFDLSWNGDISSPPKMLEFNADTPTSLFEAGVVQWFWLKDLQDQGDQFNSIHEKLVAAWRRMGPTLQKSPLYFSCLQEFPEDLVNVRYLQDCAVQAGLDTRFINVHDIGLTEGKFVDLEDKPIEHIFKLYPWEWMSHEDFAPALHTAGTLWIEPPWKMLLSNKAILPLMWKLFPGHPNLLECHFDHPAAMNSYAVKPLLSREGANVTLVENDQVISQTMGEYGDEGFIYQQLHKLPEFEGNHPVIGSWIIGGRSAGIGIRETNALVTDNFSRFVPHLIAPKNC